MRSSVSVGVVLLQLFVVMPLFLGGAFLAIDAVYQLRAADVFRDPIRCAVNVEYVWDFSRTNDPLYVVTDGGDCDREEQYLVDYGDLPVAQRITEGELAVELGQTSDGVVVARPASVTDENPDIVGALLWLGVGMAVVGAVLEVVWLVWLVCARRARL